MSGIELPAHLSYSSASTLKTCGAQYFYERGLGLVGQPGWATVGGSGVHYASEEWDNQVLETGYAETDPASLVDMFRRNFEKAIGEEKERSKTPEDEWRASGRATKQWPDKENKKFWLAEGPTMLKRWVSWRLNNQWEIAGVGDRWGVEVPIDFTTPTGEWVRGYIDRVMELNGEFYVVDLKSGTFIPEDYGQLATYARGLREQYGISPKWGTFWMARSGGTTEWFDLEAYTDERLDYEYRLAREQQLAGDFRPKRSNLCNGCSVRRYCAAFGGDLAGSVMQPWQMRGPVTIASPPERV